MKIGVDIDDVLVESMKAYLEEYNKNHNENLKFENITNHDFWKILDEFTEKDMVDFFDDFFEEKAYKLNLIEGAKEGLVNLSNSHEIILVTSRPILYKEKTKKFLDIHFPELDLEIVHAETNSFNHKGMDKVDICKEKEIELMIEDQIRYAKKCADNGIKTLLFEKPWNKESEEHENIIKVKDWKEILEKINGY